MKIGYSRVSTQGQNLYKQIDILKQFDCDLISQRTIEGLNAARARGRKGGRPKVNAKDITLAIKMYNSRNYSISEITKATNINKTTLYRYINFIKNIIFTLY